MKTTKYVLGLASVLMVLGLFSGCDSSGGGGDVDIYGGVYMGVGMGGIYDPWYYGPSHYHSTVIVTPPPRPMPPRPMPRPSPRMR